MSSPSPALLLSGKVTSGREANDPAKPTVQTPPSNKMPGSNGSQGGEGFHCFRGDRSAYRQPGRSRVPARTDPKLLHQGRVLGILAVDLANFDDANERGTGRNELSLEIEENKRLAGSPNHTVPTCGGNIEASRNGVNTGFGSACFFVTTSKVTSSRWLPARQ